MKDEDRIILLKKIFKFTLEIIDFHDELIKQNKAPIAKRILTSTFSAISSMQKIFECDKISELQANKKNSVTNFKNVIYWLEQCEKSGYLFNENLLLEAHELYAVCTE
ncbi:MAG TPA: hypothetical protein PKN32_01030 [Bacteroidales bacterium]|nr:hypothetical protein [Bacteroidales bacterium]